MGEEEIEPERVAGPWLCYDRGYSRWDGDTGGYDEGHSNSDADTAWSCRFLWSDT